MGQLDDGAALELGFPLIDLTPSTTVIHQNHDYGHVAARSGSHWEGPEADRNRELARRGSTATSTAPRTRRRLLTPSGLAPARSRRHVRAKAEEFVALRPVAAPLRRLVRGARRLGFGRRQPAVAHPPQRSPTGGPLRRRPPTPARRQRRS